MALSKVEAPLGESSNTMTWFAESRHQNYGIQNRQWVGSLLTTPFVRKSGFYSEIFTDKKVNGSSI